MKRLLTLSVAVVYLCGCGAIQTSVRTERGPLLGTSQRTQVIPGAGIRGTVETHFPTLSVRFDGYDLCRTEEVQRYAEQRITEKSAPEAGPAIATGLPTLLTGLGLFLARGLFSDAPNTSAIDANGHYGVSDRHVATTWSYVLMAIGGPAVIAGAVEYAQTGVSTETRKREEVADQKDVPCHPRPMSGTAQVVEMNGIGPSFPVTNGVLTLQAAAVRDHPIETFTLNGAPVTVDAQGSRALDAFQACAQVLPGPAPDALPHSSDDALERMAGLSKLCDGLPEQPAKALADRVAQEQQRREASQPRLPAVHSFDEALSQYAPSLTLAPDSPDLAALDVPARLVGQSVRVRGILSRRISPNIVVVKLGERPVLVLLQPEALWNTDFPIGSRVEAVAVVAGTQKLDDLTAPLLRAIWMRPAFVAMPSSPPSP